jgi:hypothetical protein
MEAMMPIRHNLINVLAPAEIHGLARDCRRVLESDYNLILAAADDERQVKVSAGRSIDAQGFEIYVGDGARHRSSGEIATDVRAAVAEYTRTAALWGVDVAAGKR